MKILALLCLLASFAANAGPSVVYGQPYPFTPGTSQPYPLTVNSAGQITTTLLAGEDQTNGVMKVEHQFSYKAGVTADAAVGSAGTRFLHSVTCAGNDAAATAGDMTIRDATAAGAGTVVQTINFQAAYLVPFTIIIDATFATGIYFDFTTTADVMCSAAYR